MIDNTQRNNKEHNQSYHKVFFIEQSQQFEVGDRVLLRVSPWKGVVRFGKKDANLHVPLDEIKVDKTLCFVEEPVEIMDREIKRLKRRKVALVKVSCSWTELLSLLVKSQEEISIRRGYCDNRDLSRYMISFEVYDHLILSAFVFGDEYSICSLVVIMERNGVLHAMLRQ
ncbi:hypothetical protein Tco_0806801 [Tanacetum coccineum]